MSNFVVLYRVYTFYMRKINLIGNNLIAKPNYRGLNE
jgi:hypothetical protein